MILNYCTLFSYKNEFSLCEVSVIYSDALHCGNTLDQTYQKHREVCNMDRSDFILVGAFLIIFDFMGYIYPVGEFGAE